MLHVITKHLVQVSQVVPCKQDNALILGQAGRKDVENCEGEEGATGSKHETCLSPGFSEELNAVRKEGSSEVACPKYGLRFADTLCIKFYTENGRAGGATG